MNNILASAILPCSMMKSIVAIALAVLLALLAGGCDGSGEAPLVAPSEPAAPLNTAVQVRVAVVAEASFGTDSTVSGVVEPFRRAVASAEVAGRVLQRLVEPGDQVQMGQALARLDDERVRIARDQARARKRSMDVNLAEARSELRRGENLRKQHFISEDTLETLRFAVQRSAAALQEAQAALDAAERALSDTVVKAPFDGTTELVHVQTGDYLNPGAPVATLVDFTRARVRAGVTAREASRLAGVDVARIGLDAMGASLLEGEVHSIARISDPATGTYAVEIWLDNPADELREGMLATVRLPYAAAEQSLVVPGSAVFRRDGRMHVYVVEGATARLRAIEAGRIGSTQVEIVGGLNPGEQVVIDGQFALRDGAPVQVNAG